jgi:hypothetical protein
MVRLRMVPNAEIPSWASLMLIHMATIDSECWDSSPQESWALCGKVMVVNQDGGGQARQGAIPAKPLSLS